MTSAIDNMSVAEVRKFLGECRKKHTIQTPDHPMFITDVLSNGMQLQEFALKFQQGHHQKRHNKSRKHGQGRTGHGGTSSSDDDDYYDEYNTSDEDTNSSSTSSSSDPQPSGWNSNDVQQHPQSKPSDTPPPSKQPTHKYTLSSKNGDNTSSSISNTLTAAIVKKRGRPKKDKTPPSQPHSLQNSDHISSSSRTEHHSRSLMEFVKKPTKRTKI